MLITKFNKMIRNRIVWWIIGGIVIITFVGFFTPQGGCDAPSTRSQIGSLDGQPVTDNELRLARFNTYLELCLMTGRILRLTPEIDKELREEAWRRIAALRTAEKLGIKSTKEEVLVLLTRDPSFHENGVFSKARYQQFVMNTLANLGTSAAQFENYLRESIILQKLHNLTTASTWVDPSTMQRLVARYADRFSIQYVTIDSNSVTDAYVEPSDDDLRAYFNANTNEFMVPAKVSVRYVAFPISNHLAAASITADSIDDYYDTHTDEFTTVDTNSASTGTNVTRTIIPLDEVRGAISNQLLWTEATQTARDKATDMIIALAPSREGNITPFEKVAQDLGLTVLTSALFDASSEFPGLDDSQDLVTSAFRLSPTPDEYVNDAVTTKDHVYVLALATNTEPYLPSFETVKKDVVAPARAKAVSDAISAKAKSMHRSFSDGLARKESFMAIARQQMLNVSTSDYFTAYSAPEALSKQEIFEELSNHNPGELTEIIPVDESYMISYLLDRAPGSVEDINAVRTQLGTSNSRRLGRIIFTEFQNYLLQTGKKTDSTVLATPADVDEP
jgi:peptidyl-prolyl cis-trans isomerase D